MQISIFKNLHWFLQNVDTLVYNFFFSFSYFVLECQGPDLPRSFLIQRNSENNFSVKMVVNEYPELQDLVNSMSMPQMKKLEIPVPNSDRVLQARLFYPPELRVDEFIKFPLVLHV